MSNGTGWADKRIQSKANSNIADAKRLIHSRYSRCSWNTILGWRDSGGEHVRRVAGWQNNEQTELRQQTYVDEAHNRSLRA